MGSDATAAMGMGSHQSSRMLSDTWLTPPWILNALGPFDLDPYRSARVKSDAQAEAYDALVKALRTAHLVLFDLVSESRRNPDLPVAEVLARIGGVLPAVPNIPREV